MGWMLEINFGGNWVSSCLSFFLSTSTAATYIFNAPTCTVTIITIKPCPWKAEFQHFIPTFNRISLLCRFNRISLLCGYHSRRGFAVKGGPKIGWRLGDFQHISVSCLQCRSWGFYFREICQVIQTQDQNQGHNPVFGGKQRLRYKTTKIIH